MKDKFAGDDEEIRDQRHKGKRIGTLWIHEEGITGDATLTVDFLDRPAIERLDALLDIIGVISREYNSTLEGMWSEKQIEH